MKKYEPAFPSEQGHIPEGTWNQTYEPGMTMRDYMAISMANGILSIKTIKMMRNSENYRNRWKIIAKDSYAMADAMMEEREK